MATEQASGERTTRAGVTLIEMAMVLAILTVLAAVAVPNILGWQASQRVKGAARDVADILLVARSEAIRTGNNFVVFHGNVGATDPAGTPLPAPFVVLNDGPVATANCRIDVGEAMSTVQPVDGVSWGAAQATSAVSTDTGGAPFDPPPPPAWDGGTFTDPAGNPVNWLLFRADGVPLAFDASGGDCGVVGRTGGGGGGLYITNGERDYGVVLTPLGGVRVHLWDGADWSS